MNKFFLPLLLCLSCTSSVSEEKKQVTAHYYKQGKELLEQGQKKAACDQFRALKSTNTFPLTSLLELKILQSCSFTAKQLANRFEQHKENIPPYLTEQYLKTAYDLAHKNKMYEEALLLGLAYNKYPKIKSEREDIARDLIQWSKKLSSRSLQHASQDNFEQIAPRFIKDPTPQQFFMIAKDYAHIRNFTRARFFYNKVVKHSELELKERMEAYYRKALSYKLQRNKVSYSKELTKMISWLDKQPTSGSEELNLEAWSYRIKSVRALWTIGERARAEKRINTFLNNSSLPNIMRAQIYLISGLIDLEKKNYKSAYQKFYQSIRTPDIDEETLETASWSLFWGYYTADQFDEALASISLAIGKTTESSFKNKLLYWRGRTYLKLGEQKQAQRDFQDIAKDHSYQYYAILAHGELGLPLKAVSFSHYPPKSSRDRTLLWLKAVEEEELTKQYLQEKSGDQQNDDIAYTDYHFAKWYEGGIFHFFSLKEDKDEQQKIYRKHLPLAYPIPFQEIIQPLAQKRQLPAAFIYAIARQESAFNPYARSWADAFGLLQVTPEKAKQLKRQYSLPYSKPEDLYDIATNVEMGSLLLKKLAKKSGHNFISITASYNAGINALRRWKKQRHRQDPIEFIEMIPYKETRNYIKLVFRNYITYRRLLGEDVVVTKKFFKGPFL